jgi:hypothetical protein
MIEDFAWNGLRLNDMTFICVKPLKRQVALFGSAVPFAGANVRCHDPRPFVVRRKSEQTIERRKGGVALLRSTLDDGQVESRAQLDRIVREDCIPQPGSLVVVVLPGLDQSQISGRQRIVWIGRKGLAVLVSGLLGLAAHLLQEA